MRIRVDLLGKRFGKLTVVKMAENSKDNKTQWLCKCDCGNEKVIRTNNLTSGQTRSCGCLIKESRAVVSEKLKGNKSPRYKHGMCYTRIHIIHRNMKGRCYNKNDHAYPMYGGRGIEVCKEWKDDFLNFYDWAMQSGYNDSLTIDRIDVNGNYEPNNCRWVGMKEQQNNRTNNVFLSYNDETHTLSEWAEKIGITKSAIYHRYERKKPIKEILAEYVDRLDDTERGDNGFGSTGK